MAVWQMDLQVVPRQRALSIAHQRKSAKEFANTDDADYWLGASLPADYAKRLASILSAGAPWATGWLTFGEADGNRVDVLLAGSQIDEVRVRIDVREIDFEILERVRLFVAECDCVFVSSAGQVVEPRMRDLCIEIEASPAANFVTDPERFLQHLRRWLQ